MYGTVLTATSILDAVKALFAILKINKFLRLNLYGAYITNKSAFHRHRFVKTFQRETNYPITNMAVVAYLSQVNRNPGKNGTNMRLQFHNSFSTQIALISVSIINFSCAHVFKNKLYCGIIGRKNVRKWKS